MLTNAAAIQVFGVPNHLMASDLAPVLGDFSEDTLRRLDRANLAVQVAGQQGIIARRLDYLKDPEFQECTNPTRCSAGWDSDPVVACRCASYMQGRGRQLTRKGISMTMIILIRSALLAALIIGAGFASASAGEDKAGKDGADRRLAVSEHEAAEIAAAEGVAEIREIKVKRGQWKIEGTDADGRKIEILIDGDSGEVVKAEQH